MSMRKSDHPEVRKLMLMRRADTEAGATHNIGGVRKSVPRRKPSMPKMPWDEDYQERKPAHARGNGSEQEYQAYGRTGDGQGKAEPGLSGFDGADHGAHREG